MSTARDEVKARIDAIESSYEFFLAYAAQGLTTDEGAKSGAQLRDFLAKLEGALDGLADRVAEAADDMSAAEGVTSVDGSGADGDASEAWAEMVEVVRADAGAAAAAVRLVSARAGVSSQLIDNLNANIHLRALLTDLFLVDDLLDG